MTRTVLEVAAIGSGLIACLAFTVASWLVHTSPKQETQTERETNATH